MVFANPGAETALHDTYYAVAHFHYALSLGAVFVFFAAWYTWFGKVIGYAYAEIWGQLHFWTTLAGAALIFFPQHFLVLSGAPRRSFDDPDAFADWNRVSVYGYTLTLVGTAFFLIGLIDAFLRRQPNVNNQWGRSNWFKTPMLWVIVLIFLFTLGGVSSAFTIADPTVGGAARTA